MIEDSILLKRDEITPLGDLDDALYCGHIQVDHAGDDTVIRVVFMDAEGKPERWTLISGEPYRMLLEEMAMAQARKQGISA